MTNEVNLDAEKILNVVDIMDELKYTKKNLKWSRIGVISLAFCAGILEYILFKTPYPEKVESGYLNPSKIEIKVKDLENDSIPETIMNYKGIDYLLIEDSTGKPKIQGYKINSGRTIPSKIIHP